MTSSMTIPNSPNNDNPTTNNNPLISQKSHIYTIQPHQRLSFSIESDNVVILQLIEGMAEYLGTEMLLNKSYQLRGFMQSMVFSWQGAKVRIQGETRTASVRDTREHMEMILGIHEDLQERRFNGKIDASVAERVSRMDSELEKRQQQQQENASSSDHSTSNRGSSQQSRQKITSETHSKLPLGPRVLICGEANTGKSSVARILASYACRMKHDIILADLDIEGGLLSLPAMVSATELSLPVSIETDLQYGPVPMTYFVGNTQITKNETFVYDRALERLAHRVNRKLLLSTEKKAKALRGQMGASRAELKPHGGVIIDTWRLDGQFKGPSYDTVVKAVDEFKIDYLIVNGGEDYYDHFMEKFPHVKVVRLDRFPGASSRGKLDTGNVQRKIRDYFYGCGSKIGLSPHTLTVKFDQIQFCRVKSRHVPRGSLPINQEERQTIDKCQVEFIQPGGSHPFLHHVFAVSAAHSEEDITNKNIYGIIYVNKLNMEKKTISLLAPIIGRLPSPILMLCQLGTDLFSL